MKTSVALCVLLFPISAWGQPADHHPRTTNVIRLTSTYLNQLADALRTNHPGLRAFDARVKAASHATNAIRGWDEPAFKFGGVVASDRGPILREDGDLVYGVDQKLPLFGKPAAARKQALTEADVAVAKQAMQFQVLRRDLAK